MAAKQLNEIKRIYGALPEGAEHELDPVTEAVLYHFGAFCSVPHGSGHEQAVTEILAERFGGADRQVRIDEAGNLIVDIPASPGCEDAPLLMLQGHMDMVCAVRPGSEYVPERDSIKAQLKRNPETGRLMLESNGDSSLGADCGLGDAAVLWLFGRREASDSEGEAPSGGTGSYVNEPAHGPVRVLMTADEENGLGGAMKLSGDVFEHVRYVINVDGFNCGRFVAGSAGGRREKYRRPAETVTVRDILGDAFDSARAFEVCVSGFIGGHSGSDIAAGRVNAPWMIGRFLRQLEERGVRYALSSFTGGKALNAIPSDAQAVIAVGEKDAAAFQQCLLEMIELIQKQYRGIDDRGTVEYYETAMPELAFSKDCASALTGFVASVTVGVKQFMEDMPDTPETSCNLGSVNARNGREYVDVHLFERSMGGASHEALLEEHRTLSARWGFERVYSLNYPAWEYRKENRLPHLAKKLFEEETGRPGEVKAVHVGLEPAVFYGIDPSLQMVCMGADILDPHSVNERVPVDTIRPFALTLRRLVEQIAKWNKNNPQTGSEEQ